MVYDIFAFWDQDKVRMDEIPDSYTKVKYLVTRDIVDAREAHRNILLRYAALDMSPFIPSLSMSEIMPPFSFMLQMTFVLATPYLSRDDDELHVCDNPMRKDKVFKVPMVSASSWKGNMRWTARRITDPNPDKSDDGVTERLFGNERKEENRLHRGRLNFFPTFFDQVGIEVINPHGRKTKAGTLPIYFETVPAGASGIFTLLYVPFDLIGHPLFEMRKQVSSDLNLVCHSLHEMMFTYGFSAKKGTGFGIVEEDVKGTFEVSGFPIYKQQSDANAKIDSSHPFAKLAKLRPSVTQEQTKDNRFSSFEGLEHLVQRVRGEVLKNGE